MSEKWERVGECGVDSGSIVIGDPCYFATADSRNHLAATWEDYCKKTGCGVGGQQINRVLEAKIVFA